jgi:hypothetical protein
LFLAIETAVPALFIRRLELRSVNSPRGDEAAEVPIQVSGTVEFFGIAKSKIDEDGK